MIGVVDYGLGNLPSVTKALERVGASVEITSRPVFDAYDALVLPGVGHFGAGARLLREGGFEGPLRAWSRPLLGICVGLQLLFATSDEDPGERALGLVDGHVRRIQAPGLKIPHMGWNVLENARGSLKVIDGQRVYFVHSFAVEPADASLVAATTSYGSTICAAIEQDNIVAVQFHPEKSGDAGRAFLAEWVRGV